MAQGVFDCCARVWCGGFGEGIWFFDFQLGATLSKGTFSLSTKPATSKKSCSAKKKKKKNTNQFFQRQEKRIFRRKINLIFCNSFCWFFFFVGSLEAVAALFKVVLPNRRVGPLRIEAPLFDRFFSRKPFELGSAVSESRSPCCQVFSSTCADRLFFSVFFNFFRSFFFFLKILFRDFFFHSVFFRFFSRLFFFFFCFQLSSFVLFWFCFFFFGNFFSFSVFFFAFFFLEFFLTNFCRFFLAGVDLSKLTSWIELDPAQIFTSDACSICLFPLKQEPAVRLGNCHGHAFHKECLQQYALKKMIFNSMEWNAFDRLFT